MNAPAKELVEKAIVELIKKHNVACDQLTEAQMAEAINQAIASGDFLRHVRASDDGQCVTYIPFREADFLRSKVARLERLLEENGIEKDNESAEYL